MELTAAELATRSRAARCRRGDPAPACDVVRDRLARRSSPARASSRSWPSATVTTSSPTRSRAARRSRSSTDSREHVAPERRRDRAGRRRVRRAGRPRSRGPRRAAATSSSSASPARPARRRTKDLTAAALGAPVRGAREPRVVQQRDRPPAHAARGARRHRSARARRWARASHGNIAALCAIAQPDGRRDHQHRAGPRRVTSAVAKASPGSRASCSRRSTAVGHRGPRRRRPRHARARGPHRSHGPARRGRGRRRRCRRRRRATDVALDAELRPPFVLDVAVGERRRSRSRSVARTRW